MASVHKPAGRDCYYVKLFHPVTKVQIKKSTGTGDYRAAQRFARDLERNLRIEAQRTPRPATAATAPATTGPTIAELVPAWMKDRERQKLKAVRNDWSRTRNHILPALGDLVAAEVKPKDIRAFVVDLQARGLAARTTRNVYTLLHRFFRHLVVEEVITISPCQLERGDLPRVEDKDPEWRVRARFSRSEAERIVTSTVIPPDRRLVYTLLFYAGLRQGEVAALRWRHVDTTREPLGALIIANTGTSRGTKTRTTREVPIHPDLAEVLTAWREQGWAAMNGRRPKEDDLVVPSRDGAEQVRRPQPMWERWQDDLERVGLRKRDMHATRRAFVDFGLEAGVAEEVLTHITHTPRKTMMNAYGRRPWKQLCEAMRAIEIRRHTDAETVAEPESTGPRNGPQMVPGVVPGAETAPGGAAKRYESLLNSRRASGARRGTRSRSIAVESGSVRLSAGNSTALDRTGPHTTAPGAAPSGVGDQSDTPSSRADVSIAAGWPQPSAPAQALVEAATPLVAAPTVASGVVVPATSTPAHRGTQGADDGPA